MCTTYFTTLISVFVLHLVCHWNHSLSGKVNWLYVGAQGQPGTRPQQMAMSFTYNTTHWQAGVVITLLIIIIKIKKIPSTLGDPLQRLKLFWLHVNQSLENECVRGEMGWDRDVVKPSALLSVSLSLLVSWQRAMADWWVILTGRQAESVHYLEDLPFNYSNLK